MSTSPNRDRIIRLILALALAAAPACGDDEETTPCDSRPGTDIGSDAGGGDLASDLGSDAGEDIADPGLDRDVGAEDAEADGYVSDSGPEVGDADTVDLGDATTGDPVSDPFEEPELVLTFGYVRFINACSDCPPLELSVVGEGEPLFADVEYGQGTEFVAVPTGPYDLRVEGADGGSGSTEQVDLIGSAIAEDEHYVVAAVNHFESLGAHFEEDDVEGAISGVTRLRWVVANDGFAPLDIYWLASGGGESLLTGNVAYGSWTFYMPFDNLATSGGLVGLDLDDEDPIDRLYPLDELQALGESINLYVVLNESGRVVLLAQPDDGEVVSFEPPVTTEIRVLCHAVSAGSIDVFFNETDEQVADDLFSGRSTGYTSVEDLSGTFQVNHSSEGPVCTSEPYTLLSGQRYTAVWSEGADGIEAFREYPPAPAPGTVPARAISLFPEYLVSIEVRSEADGEVTVLGTEVGFFDATDYRVLAANVYDVTVDVPDAHATITFDDVSLSTAPSANLVFVIAGSFDIRLLVQLADGSVEEYFGSVESE